jgi:MFS family permease
MTDAQAAERSKWLALALLAATQFVIVLDAAIVNVAIPSIGRDLHFSQENLTWIPNAYALTFGGFLLLGGRMADLLGRRRLFMVGLVVFSVASLLGGLSASEGQLIAARALQGLGAALLAPSALSMVTTTFAEGPERNKALGVWGAVSGSGGGPRCSSTRSSTRSARAGGRARRSACWRCRPRSSACSSSPSCARAPRSCRFGSSACAR